MTNHGTAPGPGATRTPQGGAQTSVSQNSHVMRRCAVRGGVKGTPGMERCYTYHIHPCSGRIRVPRRTPNTTIVSLFPCVDETTGVVTLGDTRSFSLVGSLFAPAGSLLIFMSTSQEPPRVTKRKNASENSCLRTRRHLRCSRLGQNGRLTHGWIRYLYAWCTARVLGSA